MQEIGFTTYPDITIITSEKLGENIEQMAQDIPTIFSLVSNDLSIHSVGTHLFLLSRHIRFYWKDIPVKVKLTILT